ncbi:hypothetical protein ROZALSC1DRAFT_28068 [Rozella allomycis CSF55]|uniref:Bet v1-like protein n=1 Tax=Rozella allomycis (strain CSF55) TaxID=988480 RepID=A0A075AU54_ROZAC|nr:hypothetical protein O9G_000445 [Rozella allomycis CSF55]RKP20441.1 hypothetical protein ROZALSC1DRAFT_28068 [Rozella allomycis CSF55]|eukprot:EPZ33670.1 hypothetical protein O9G_000445 [Rozella allomycis CSF55]
MATHISETRVFKTPENKIWDIIRPLDFKWLTTVATVDSEGTGVGALKKVTYKDGKFYPTIPIDLQHFITYELIESNPPTHCMSAIHTIRLKRVTHDNSTFAEWVSDYSNDATQSVLQDSTFKKKEGFSDLSKFLKE